MTRARVALPTVLAALLFIAVIASGHALAGPNRGANGPLGPGDVTVTLTIQHSHFSPDHLSVRPGTTVRFVVHNNDPIGHELIVGDAGVHERHETGTEPVHPPRPGEISVPAQATAETTFSFDDARGNPVVYACHLPGHFRYGMSGQVDIVGG
jgi:plastocyanin